MRQGVEIEGIYLCDQGLKSRDDTMVEHFKICVFPVYFVVLSFIHSTLNVHNRCGIRCVDKKQNNVNFGGKLWIERVFFSAISCQLCCVNTR